MSIEDLPLEAIASLTEPGPEPEQPKKEPKDTGAVIIFKMCIEDLALYPSVEWTQARSTRGSPCRAITR